MKLTTSLPTASKIFYFISIALAFTFFSNNSFSTKHTKTCHLAISSPTLEYDTLDELDTLAKSDASDASDASDVSDKPDKFDTFDPSDEFDDETEDNLSVLKYLLSKSERHASKKSQEYHKEHYSLLRKEATSDLLQDFATQQMEITQKMNDANINLTKGFHGRAYDNFFSLYNTTNELKYRVYAGLVLLYGLDYGKAPMYETLCFFKSIPYQDRIKLDDDLSSCIDNLTPYINTVLFDNPIECIAHSTGSEEQLNERHADYMEQFQDPHFKQCSTQKQNHIKEILSHLDDLSRLLAFLRKPDQVQYYFSLFSNAFAKTNNIMQVLYASMILIAQPNPPKEALHHHYKLLSSIQSYMLLNNRGNQTKTTLKLYDRYQFYFDWTQDRISQLLTRTPIQ